MVKDIRRYSNYNFHTTATIALNATASSLVDIHPWSIGMMLIPPAFTGTAVKFRVGEGASTMEAAVNGTLRPMLSAPGGTAMANVTVATGKWVALRSELMMANTLQVISLSTETAARSLVFSFKG